MKLIFTDFYLCLSVPFVKSVVNFFKRSEWLPFLCYGHRDRLLD
jgi:hypothetical protein